MLIAMNLKNRPVVNTKHFHPRHFIENIDVRKPLRLPPCVLHIYANGYKYAVTLNESTTVDFLGYDKSRRDIRKKFRR